jgi:hypothetical protein
MAIRSLILHNDNIRLPSSISDVHVIHVSPVATGPEIKHQAIEKYRLQQLAESEPQRIILYANPLGTSRLRVDSLESLPAHITDLYVRITSPAQADASP